MSLQLFDILLRSPFHVVIEHLTNCCSIVQQCLVQPEMMHSVRVQLEEDMVSYLSLLPDYISCKNGSGEDLIQYLREAHNKVVLCM